jgi:hypothetical protein
MASRVIPSPLPFWLIPSTRLSARAGHGVTTVPYPRDADNSASRGYVDLRANLELVAQLPEVRERPALADGLRRLNAPNSMFRTTGCGEWWVTRTPGEGVDRAGRLYSYIQFCHLEPELFQEAGNDSALLYRVFHYLALDADANELFRETSGIFEVGSFSIGEPTRVGAGVTFWLETESESLDAARTKQDLELRFVVEFLTPATGVV